MATRKKPSPQAIAPVEEDEDRNGASIQSVITAALVLDELAREGTPIGVSDLARRLGTTRAKAHRYLSTLRQAGLVEQDSLTEKYRLGLRLLSLSQAAMDQMEVRKIAEPYLKVLRDKCGQTVAMSIPTNGVPVVVSSIQAPNIVTLNVMVGGRLVPHATAHGRVVLAFSTPELVNVILKGPLQAMTPRTPVKKSEILARLDIVRERFYEQAVGESLLGISTLAAPVFDAGENIVAVVAIVGLDQYVTDPPRPEFVELLLGCTAAISSRLDSRRYQQAGIRIAPPFLDVT